MRMYFLDSTEDKKHEYNQNDFARFHNQIIGEPSVQIWYNNDVG